VPLKNREKYFSGNYYVKFGHFSGKNHVKFGHFVNFYQRVSIASYANRWYSQRRNVRLSVRYTPVFYQNEES